MSGAACDGPWEGVPDGLKSRVEGALGLRQPQELPTPTLTAAALALLTDARPSARRDAEAAFDLLAADGLLTEACLRALDDPDPDAALGSVLEAARRAAEDAL